LRERVTYIRDLTLPRVQGSVTHQDVQDDQTSAAKVPFMITKQMKLDLMDLGYTIKNINSFTPLEAHEIISKGISITGSHSDLEREMKNETESEREISRSDTDTLTEKIHPPIQDLLVLTKEPENPHENLRIHLLNVNRIQSGLGNVKLKVNSSLDSIDRANDAISAALDQIQK